MSTNLFRPFSRAALAVLFALVVGFGAVGCVDTYGTAPVYRGNYYAYDAYPYGYRGYPGYPYYGAPFGGGAAALVVENSGYGYRGGYHGYRRGYRRDGRDYRRDGNHHRRSSQRVNRSDRNAGERNVPNGVERVREQ
ncbi:MAG: hypothetical protein M3Z64_07790 [Verrucomicrobiota bacterium]|nr:hypothetical protein [Verrucomicrobiota bacterium]